MRRIGRKSRGGGSSVADRLYVSLGGCLTGLMVALSSTFLFAILTGAVLQAQGHDLHKVVRGETPWASPGAGTAFVLAVFLSFLWGGYTAGRMGAGAGGLNGAMVPVIALLALGAMAAVRVGVQRADSFDFPFGVGTLPLDANFTPLGIAVVAGVVISLLLGGIWGGIIGSRWHLKGADEFDGAYESAGADSFTDLVERSSRY